MAERDRFQILSISGGGYRGLYAAAVLVALEEKAGKPLGRCFDLIAGTSIGGVIGLCLAHERPMPEVLQAFRKHGTRIFSNRPAPRTWWGIGSDLCRMVFKPKYQAKGLQTALEDMLGMETILGDALHPVIVPTVNVTTGKPQFFKTPHHKRFQTDWKVRVVDVAMATSAAPTIFPLAKVGSSYFADGGLYANSPELSALHEATHFLEISEQDVHVLSVGTTTSQFSFSHVIGQNLGVAKWMIGNRLVSMIISSQQQYEQNMMRHRLGNRYIRIDENQSKEQQEDLGLDVATLPAQEMLTALGQESAKKALGDSRLAEVLAYNARVPKFHPDQSN